MSRSARVVPVVATVAAALVLSACSASDGSGDSSTSPAGGVPTSSSAPQSSTAAPSTPTGVVASTATSQPSPTAAKRGALTQCAESQLRASVQLENLAGINRHVVRLIFVNTSTSACTLTGYPGAAIEDSSGHQVQQAHRTVGGVVGGTVEKPATLVVVPGSMVFAYLEGASTREQGAAQAGCDAPKYPRILVTPPNTKTPVPFTIGWPQCYAFDIHPVRQDVAG